MKKGWETKQISEVCEIKPPKSEARERVAANALVSFAPMEDLGIDRKFLNASQTKPLASVVGSYTYFADGDVLLAKITPCFENGKLGIASGLKSGVGFGSSEYVVFRPSPVLDKEFLYYFLARPAFRTEGAARMSGAVGHKRVSKEFIESYPIPVPPLPEQHRIVGILDEAFAGLATAKANAEKNLHNARALFESHLQSVFSQRGKGWVETTLDSCCEQIFAGGDVPKDRLSPERTAKYSVPIYSNGEKNSGLYGFTDVARVIKPSLTVSARGTLGYTAIRTEPFLPVVRLIVLIPDQKLITLSFLYYAVVGMDFGNTGTSIPQLTVPNFKESKLYVPSLSEQKAIVEKLDALSSETTRLAAICQQKLAALEALKKSLLHQAFSGEL